MKVSDLSKVASRAAIPQNWELVPLSEIAEVRLGRQRSPDKAHGAHMRPYMRAANVTWAGIAIDDVKEMNFSPAEALVYQLREGDILLSEASGSPSEVGKPAVWRGEVAGACFQNTLIRVRAPRSLVAFLHRHFLNDALSGRFAAASRGVGIHHLGAQALSEWLTAVPPLSEQDRLVEALDSYLTRLDAAAEGLKRVEGNLKRYRASVLKAAVEGRLVPTEAALAKKEGRSYEPASVLLDRILTERRRRWAQSELAKMKAKGETPKTDASTNCDEPSESMAGVGDRTDLPEGWTWATVEEVASVVSGNTPKGIEAAGSSVGITPWYRVSDMNAVGNEAVLGTASVNLTPTDARRLGLHVRPPGTIVFPKRGGAIATNKKRRLGRPATFDLNIMGVVPDAAIAEYLWLWFLKLDLATLSDGSNVPQINHRDVAPLLLPLPPCDEQKRIILESQRLLSGCDAVSHVVSAGMQRIARLRQSILKWAFEGKLVDQDPNDEPASVLLARIKAERDREKEAPTAVPRRRRVPGAKAKRGVLA